MGCDICSPRWWPRPRMAQRSVVRIPRDGRAFSRSVGAQEREEPADGHVQIETVEGAQRSEGS